MMNYVAHRFLVFFFQAEDGIRDSSVTGVQTCALPIYFLIRGTRFNMGVLLKYMIDAGADSIGDPSQSHCVAIDARAPLYDGGICTRVDCVSLGVVLNRDAMRFYDAGEEFWPKRYAIWGRLVAH